MTYDSSNPEDVDGINNDDISPTDTKHREVHASLSFTQLEVESVDVNFMIDYDRSILDEFTY